jgi:hypothetical protein
LGGTGTTRSARGGSGILPYMVASVEIITCLVAIAGSVKLTAAEYVRLRKNRQMRQALRLALANPA